MAASARLLLTGATGFLGGAIAASLFASGRSADVLFLVRAAEVAEGRARLAECMARFAVDPAQVERLRADQFLCGDLADVAAFARDARLREVRDVVNCAALASFSNHPDIFRVNVEGTEAFARALLAKARLRRFIQVGTAMSCGADAPRLVLEGYEPGEDAVQLVPYTASKLEGERRLRRLAGLPLVIARPSIIVGDTRRGCLASPSIFWVFRMARALRGFPCPISGRIDVVPVDWCAQAILSLVRAPRLAHDCYHLSAGAASCSFAQIDAAVAAGLGEPMLFDYRQMDYETIKGKQDRFDELFGPCIKPVMLRAIKLYGEFASLEMLFDNQRLLAEGIEPPPAFTSYAGLCARTAHGVPIASQMQYDFKGMPTRREAVRRVLSVASIAP